MAAVSIEERMRSIKVQQEATNKRMDDFRTDISTLRSDMNTRFDRLTQMLFTGWLAITVTVVGATLANILTRS